MRVEVGGAEYAHTVRSLVASALGRLHGYYAYHAVASGAARVAVLRVGGRVAGVEVFYRAALGATSVCVHYYLVVRRGLRGRGLGKVLVASVEEVCGADVYVATTTSDNLASLRLFASMCYERARWHELEELYGWDLTYELVRLTCGYEDDVVMVKGGLGRLLAALGEWGAPEDLWERLCYEPWRRLAYGAARP